MSRPSVAVLLALLAAAAVAGCSSPTEGTENATPAVSSATTPASPASPASPVSPAPSPAAPSAAATDPPSPAATASPIAPTAPAPGSASSAARSPLVVRLDVADARAFYGEGSLAVLTVSGDAFDAVRAGLALPTGVEVVSGSFAHEGPLAAGETIELRGVVRARAPGDHALRAWAEASVPPGSRIAPSATLLLSGSATSATAAALTVPSNAPTFQLTLEPDASDAARSTLTAASSVATSARIVVVSPTGASLTTGAAEETVQLEEDDLLMRRIALQLPAQGADGPLVLAAHLYPDPAVDGRVYSDRLYFTWESGAWRVSTSEPGA